jgi:hypothetical protein
MVKRQEFRLEKHLVLNSFICNLFGKKSFEELRDILKDVDEGFDEEGRSYVFHVLLAQEGIKIPMDRLEEYDSNIKGYVDHINKGRERPVKLKYFQYLSVLFTEIFLDKYFQDPNGLLNELNDYLDSIGEDEIDFTRGDLKKLAFWMATGSGKTLIMHINYLQFMKYNRGPNEIKLDNVLLITPSETLSYQHLKEMKESNIPCDLFSGVGGYFSDLTSQNKVKILDIHKLTEEKKGQGVTVDVEHFGNKNLVFVDEGHKGTGGEKWINLRKKLTEEGFTFEYSATFSQAIAVAAKRTEAKDTLHEYAKSIIFDYSYRYFYRDGFGKDYRILNLRKDLYSQSKNMLMLANLLSFYEQKLLFDNYRNKIEEYNIEEPLWIFVGSKVRGTRERSDILHIIRFLAKVLKDRDWTVKSIKNILKGNSGLLDKQGRDLFSPVYPEKKLTYLRYKALPPDHVYHDLLERIFHIKSPAPLRLVNLKNASGEIALQAGSSDFFGVINIGDDAQFLKLVEKKSPEIPVKKDEITGSLFESIKDPNSKITILIGAKKFIEGWDCWRVSNMGLLNIGKKEGSQIIQLFGRGVRLRGKGFSLKRSSVIDPNCPNFLSILETLNVFGIEANYMEVFRDHLKAEGISVDNFVEIDLPIEVNEEYLEKDLVVPSVDTTRFKKEEFFQLEVDETIIPTIDLIPKIETITSIEEKGLQGTASNPPRKIEQKYLDLLNWNRIYFNLLDFKRGKKWNNLVFSKEILKKIIEKGLYTLYCHEDIVKPEKFEDIWRLEDVVLLVLKKYIQCFYNQRKNIWTRENIDIVKLKPDHNNLSFEKYTLKIKESDWHILSEVQSIIDNRLEEIRKEFQGNYINNVYFDRHIYQPLLAESLGVKISPPGLNEGERNFIEDLKNFFVSNPQLFEGKEIFVLRNLPRKGIGFFETAYFYPDFIIWIKAEDQQHLIFADPHSLVFSAGLADEKINLQKEMRELGERLTRRTGKNILLDSFIISVTPYQSVKHIFKKPRNILEENHILFQHDDRKHYIEKLIAVAFDT